jgi:hypothetical protein
MDKILKLHTHTIQRQFLSIFLLLTEISDPNKFIRQIQILLFPEQSISSESAE